MPPWFHDSVQSGGRRYSQWANFPCTKCWAHLVYFPQKEDTSGIKRQDHGVSYATVEGHETQAISLHKTFLFVFSLCSNFDQGAFLVCLWSSGVKYTIRYPIPRCWKGQGTFEGQKYAAQQCPNKNCHQRDGNTAAWQWTAIPASREPAMKPRFLPERKWTSWVYIFSPGQQLGDKSCHAMQLVQDKVFLAPSSARRTELTLH